MGSSDDSQSLDKISPRQKTGEYTAPTTLLVLLPDIKARMSDDVPQGHEPDKGTTTSDESPAKPSHTSEQAPGESAV